MASWDPYLSERDREHIRLGYGKKEHFGFGKNPCVLVIDDYYSVLGLERKPFFESIKKWPGSMGLEGWAAIDKTAELLRVARGNDIPVIYVHGLEGFVPWGRRARRERLSNLTAEERAKANEIVDEVAPQPGELVMKKAAASAFHGTPLVFHLNYHAIDTVICVGESTSGCVRASVVDAATYRYDVGIVEECCFDRSEASHYINLFDMHQKYGDVISLPEATAYFDGIGEARGTLVAAR
jgi:nicotinamidase-related amidase